MDIDRSEPMSGVVGRIVGGHEVVQRDTRLVVATAGVCSSAKPERTFLLQRYMHLAVVIDTQDTDRASAMTAAFAYPPTARWYQLQQVLWIESHSSDAP